jgi:hypothetical protein
MEEDTAQQHKNSREWLQPYQFRKGQSGNPSGRKAGKSLKEYAKEMLASMSDEERQNFLHGIPKEIIWKLAEGNPDNKTDVTSKGEKITVDPTTAAIAEKYEQEVKDTL